MVKMDTSDFTEGLNDWARRVERNVPIVMGVASAATVGEAKRVAPWKDRTGNARQSIHAEQHDDLKGSRANIGIGMPYGVFLELSHGGKFRVIDPTVNGFGKVALLSAMAGLARV